MLKCDMFSNNKILVYKDILITLHANYIITHENFLSIDGC